MADHLPKVRIEVPNGESIFTRVFLDGQELRGVVRVAFDSRDVNQGPYDRLAKVTVELIADIAFEGEGVELEAKVRSYQQAQEEPAHA
jgi:hypothetical protein